MTKFSPHSERDRRFDGYGPSALPNALDGEVTAFVSGVRAGGVPATAAAAAALTPNARNILRAYAERMASLAVREADRDILLNAVIANVLGGLSSHEQESLLVMAPIEDASARIGVDLPALFEEEPNGLSYRLRW